MSSLDHSDARRAAEYLDDAAAGTTSGSADQGAGGPTARGAPERRVPAQEPGRAIEEAGTADGSRPGLSGLPDLEVTGALEAG